MDKVTIIILTKNRHLFLQRIIDYYSNYDLQVLIADESKDAYNKKLPANTSYFNYSRLSYLSRADDILKKVKTPYSVLCADDDFIVPEGISKCVDFLDENPDYVSAQGNYIFFYHSKNKIFYSPGYLSTVGIDFNENNPKERIEKFNRTFIQFYYSVHRTENLKEIFSLLKNKIDTIDFAELALGMCTLISGKNKSIPVFYSARQILYGSAGRLNSMNTYLANEKYNSFLTEISTLLSKKSNISFEEAFNFFQSSMLNFFEFRFSAKTSKTTIMRFIKATIPFSIRRSARHYMLLLKEKENQKKNIQLALKIKSIPFIIGSPENKELQTIENFVFKYNIQQ